MKIDPQLDWFKKYNTEEFSVEYDFTNDLGTGEIITNCLAASIFDSSNTDKSASMISNSEAITSDINFTISGGTAGETYNIKLVAKTSDDNKFVHYIVCEVLAGLDLNTKLGDVGINSYVTLTEVNNYIRNKYGHDSVWDQLSDEGKKRIIVQAAKDLELLNYLDEKYYDVQGLSFPRSDHTVITGNCATPLTREGFKSTNLYSTTYNRYPTNYWKYGTVHITAATPLGDVRTVDTSDTLTGDITVTASFTATPTSSTQFKVFTPLDMKIKDAQCEQALFVVQNSRIDSLENYKSLGISTVQLGDARIEFGVGTAQTTISGKAKKLLSRYIRKSLRVSRG